MPVDEDLIDRIYETAFTPELWPGLLDSLAAASGSAGGELLIFREEGLTQFAATEITRPIVAEFMANGWRSSRRIPYYHQNPVFGFVLAEDYFPPEIRDDLGQRLLQARGFDSEIGAVAPMPGGDLAVFIFDRWRELGRHEPQALQRLNALHPHLARASMIASRLGLERAQAAVATLEVLGIPAAVLTRSGRTLAANALLESVDWAILPAAFGKLTLAPPAANKLFQEAVTQALRLAGGPVRSIPIPAREESPACVVHVLPLLRSARDSLFGGEILVVATCLKASGFVPSPSVLMGLFDLTPAEARLAAALSSGKTLQEAAQALGLSFSTARTYLTRIFAKTGTHQQSQLVALLKSAHPAPPPQSR